MKSLLEAIFRITCARPLRPLAVEKWRADETMVSCLASVDSPLIALLLGFSFSLWSRASHAWYSSRTTDSSPTSSIFCLISCPYKVSIWGWSLIGRSGVKSACCHLNFVTCCRDVLEVRSVSMDYLGVVAKSSRISYFWVPVFEVD